MSRVKWKGPFIGFLGLRYLRTSAYRGEVRLTALFLSSFLQTEGPKSAAASWLHLTCRSSFLARWFIRRRLRVYNGRKWRNLYLRRWHRGWTAGGFVRPLTPAIFRKKTLTKKAKVIPITRQLREEARIADLKQIKAGQKRRPSLMFEAEKRRQRSWDEVEALR